MSIFGKNVLFSEVKGQVVLNGQAVSGAEVERSYEWELNDSEGTEKTHTDQNGLFSFPLLKKSGGIANLFPHEPVIYQRITIRYNGQEYTAWRHTKHDYENNGELNGRSLSLHCELSKKPLDNGEYFGLCEIR